MSVPNFPPTWGQMPAKVTVEFQMTGGSYMKYEQVIFSGTTPEQIQLVANNIVDDLLKRNGLIQETRFERYERIKSR